MSADGTPAAANPGTCGTWVSGSLSEKLRVAVPEMKRATLSGALLQVLV